MTKSYIYTDNSRILAQRNGGQAAAEYFYVTNRLGSVRQLIDDTGSVVRNYTYSPFGQLLEEAASGGAPANRFMFTGQWFDDEIEQYYLRARMYDPNMMRFTARDPVLGEQEQPLTIHKYLYCINDPSNKIDPEGKSALNAVLTGYALYYHGLNLAAYGAFSGDWRFFDLADATFEFMPAGIAIASLSIGVNTTLGKLTGIGASMGIEGITDLAGIPLTGIGLEGVAMDFFAYLIYGAYILNEQAELGMWPGDMEDFTDWK